MLFNSTMNCPPILSRISPRIRSLLREIGEVRAETFRSVCIIGGFVRDRLIGREDLDLDIVLEGDAIGFARQLAEAWGGEVQAHCKFRTATVTRPDGLKVDFVSARTETYPCPGALPSVRYGTIEDDLRRRDFSINALAIQLNPDFFGELVDCTDGLQDLRAGRIRALHDRSFIDDPTRIFRAIRYEGRYGFQIVEADQERIRDAIGQSILDQISGQRIRNEIDRILTEEAARQIIQRMLEFDLFRVIHPVWEIPRNFDALWNAAGQAIDWVERHLPNDQIDTEAILWMTLMGAAHHVPISAIEAISDRLALENQLRVKLIATGQLWCALDTLSASSKSSEVYQLLNLYPPEPLAFALMQPNQPDWRMEEIRNYLTHLRGVQPLITGDDLIQLGLKPGRAFADVLWKAFAAQLDGKVSTKQEACQHLGY